MLRLGLGEAWRAGKERRSTVLTKALVVYLSPRETGRKEAGGGGLSRTAGTAVGDFSFNICHNPYGVP